MAGTLLGPYFYLLQPLAETMMAVKLELCGGNQTFVVGRNTVTLAILSWDKFLSVLLARNGGVREIQKSWMQHVFWILIFFVSVIVVKRHLHHECHDLHDCKMALLGPINISVLNGVHPNCVWATADWIKPRWFLVAHPLSGFNGALFNN